MKTTTLIIVFVFVCSAHFSFAQDAHEKMEVTFSTWTINQVLETLQVKKRYAEEAQLQELVDASYMNFQTTLKKLATDDQSVIDFQLNLFLSDLRKKISSHSESNSSSYPIQKTMNGPCVNMDFEDGNTNGWDLFIGETDGSVPYSYINSVPAGPGPNHQIFAGGVDPIVGIPTVFPGGNFSVRLGNGATTGAGAARMSQSFLVDASNMYFTYNYAVIFESPVGHTLNERPYFTVRVFDENGANITCGEYSVIADAANATDYLSIVVGGETVLYSNWTTVFTNLSAYVGQNVTIEFTSGDCALGGHYGYAYVDASCSFQEITASPATICQGENSTLTAPAGLGTYLWSTGETTQSISVSAGGNYTCLLTPPQGPACSVLLDIDVTEFPTPTALFTMDQSTVCAGSDIVFTDNSSIPNPGVISSYQWDFGNGTQTPASTGAIVAVPNTTGTYLSPTHTYTTAGAFNATLTVESADGCVATYSLPIQINALPVVTTANDQTACDGASFTLNGIGANTYTWDNGITDGIAFTPSVGSITYTVTGTDLNSCTDTADVVITIHPNPIVNAGADQTICDGSSVTLNGAGAVDLSWNNGVTDGIAFTPAEGSLTYTLTGTTVFGCEAQDSLVIIVNALPVVDAGTDKINCFGEQITLSGAGANTYTWTGGITDNVGFTPAVGTITYTVTGTDLNGCTDTDQVDVTVNALPIVDAGANQTVCEGTSITLTASGATVYDWYNGVSDGIAFIQGVGTVIYMVDGTDANGCVDSDLVTVTVNPNPVLTVNPAITVCQGTSITLTATGANNYVWDNGITNGIPFNQAVGTVVYHVIGSFITGCSATDSVSVTVNPKPIVTSSNKEICLGDTVVLKGFGANSYTWSDGVIDNVAFYPEESNDYFVTGTNLFGCTASAVSKVIVHDLPIANFTMSNTDFSIVSPSSMFFNSSIDAVSYSWNFGDGSPLSNEDSPYHEFPSVVAGNYTVVLTAISNFGCVDSTERYIEIKDELILYVPNTFTPDGDNLNNMFSPVFAAGFDPNDYTLYIFNRWGQLVFESHDTTIGWNGRYGVDGEFAQDGTYSWKIDVKYAHSAKRKTFVGHVNLLR
jgi:gliding motility-associated-like protein